MKRTALIPAVLSVAALALSGVAHAQHDMSHMDSKASATEKAKSTTHNGTGVVKKIDQAKGTVTLAHGPIETLKWPAMTMSFKVADKGLLQQLKPDSKVAFSFAQQGRDYVITSVK